VTYFGKALGGVSLVFVILVKPETYRINLSCLTLRARRTKQSSRTSARSCSARIALTIGCGLLIVNLVLFWQL